HQHPNILYSCFNITSTYQIYPLSLHDALPISHVGKYEQLKEIVEFVPAYVKKLIHQFSPGPITYILKHNGVCSNEVTAGLDTIAVRIPNHPVALQLLQACQFPV